MKSLAGITLTECVPWSLKMHGVAFYLLYVFIEVAAVQGKHEQEKGKCVPLCILK